MQFMYIRGSRKSAIGLVASLSVMVGGGSACAGQEPEQTRSTGTLAQSALQGTDCVSDAECQAMVSNGDIEWSASCVSGTCELRDWSWGCAGHNSACYAAPWGAPFAGAQATCSINDNQSCLWTWRLGESSSNTKDCTSDAECQQSVTNSDVEWGASCVEGTCQLSDWSWGCNGDHNACAAAPWGAPRAGAQGTCSINNGQSCFWWWRLPADSHPHDAGMPPHDAGHHLPGPYVNPDAIPSGSSGHSTVRVRATSDVPAAGDGTGQFRTVCDFSHMNFDDPIIYPNAPGQSHLHAYFGNTDVDAYSTASSLLNSGNSTCRGGIVNRTGYWVPALVNAAGTPLTPEPLDAYYKTGYSVHRSLIQPFPQGLRMIAGANPSDPSSWPTPHTDYQCASNTAVAVGSIPSCAPGDVVIMRVRFPQCWDGVNLDSADHRSHMAYPAPGGCPPSHPVAIPDITYNVKYVVPPQGTSDWRLVSDGPDTSLPRGWSLHADWFAAWDAQIVQEWVNNCDNAGVDCHSHLIGPNREIY